jgi:flagellar basal-body rod protein FlgB
MFINRLVNQSNLPLLESVASFTNARHELIAENIANISTPGYQQKDLDQGAFFTSLRDRVRRRQGAPTSSVRFDDIEYKSAGRRQNLLFHDGNNRSAEQLMSDLSRNALMYNLSVELLRKQFGSIQNALKERVS